MATFTIEQQSQLSKEESFEKVKTFFAENEGLRNLDPSLEYSFNDAACSGQVKGSKFECKLQVSGTKPSKVTVTVNLSLLLTPFKGKIQETLQQKMGQVLG